MATDMSANPLKYVKSRFVGGKGYVTVEGREVMMKADEWETKESNGQKYLWCQKYRLWTDFPKPAK
ncbi:hypothetical protein MMC13_002293 [Lambiella insularis]|nr:hypothetical protein [Lambiella insularis]